MQAIQDILTAAGINVAGWQLRVSGWRFGGRHCHRRRRPEPEWRYRSLALSRSFRPYHAITCGSVIRFSLGYRRGRAQLDCHSALRLPRDRTYQRCPRRQGAQSSSVCLFTFGPSRRERQRNRRRGGQRQHRRDVRADAGPGAGGGVGGGIATTNLLADSEADVQRAAGAVFIGYVPPIGPQAMVVASAAHLYGDITRGLIGRGDLGLDSASWRGSAMPSSLRPACGSCHSPSTPPRAWSWTAGPRRAVRLRRLSPISRARPSALTWESRSPSNGRPPPRSGVRWLGPIDSTTTRLPARARSSDFST